MTRTRLAVVILWAGVTAIGAGVACGQEYPNKPVRIITGAAGGGGDFDARIIAQGISGPLGQSVVVDNRANTIVAADAAAKSPPDGYTLFIGGSSTWIFPLLQKAPYDPVRDFAPISLIERTVSVVAVHPSIPAKSVKELIALAKARPGELNYSSAAVGGPAHIAGELFKSMAGVKIVNVVYKSNPPAITALISGEVQLTIIDVGSVAPHIKTGKLRALAVTSAEPSVLVPGMPTVSASGLPGYEAIGMAGFFAPAKTPTAAITRISQEAMRVLGRADVKEKLLNAGVEVIGSSPEQFAATLKADIAATAKVIKDAGIRVE